MRRFLSRLLGGGGPPVKLVLLLVVGAVLVMTGTPDPARTQQTWLFQTLLNPGHMVPDAFTYFTRDVEEKTGGEVSFDMYYGGGLGIKGSQMLRAVGNRELEASSAYGAHIAGSERISEVMELPFLVPCNVELRQKVTQQMWPYWEIAFEEWGVTLLGVAQAECRNMYTKNPIRTLDDLGGLKIRSQGPIELTFTDAIGANAVTVEWTDLYSALQQGVVDGYWVTNSATVNAKLYEVVDHGWEVQYAGATTFLLMNREAFQSLTGAQQALVRESGRIAQQLIWHRVTSDDESYKQRLLRKHGFRYTKPSGTQYETMKRVSRPLWEDWMEKAGFTGKEMVNRIRSIVGEQQEMMEAE